MIQLLLFIFWILHNDPVAVANACHADHADLPILVLPGKLWSFCSKQRQSSDCVCKDWADLVLPLSPRINQENHLLSEHQYPKTSWAREKKTFLWWNTDWLRMGYPESSWLHSYVIPKWESSPVAGCDENRIGWRHAFAYAPANIAMSKSPSLLDHVHAETMCFPHLFYCGWLPNPAPIDRWETSHYDVSLLATS